VVSNIPALREVCRDAAIYCDPHDPDDIAAKVQAVAENPALRDELRRLGFARVAKFSWERCARETFAVFKRVISAAAIPH
jgi:glycosyltransferase involved in cell wall biosynthesis